MLTPIHLLLIALVSGAQATVYHVPEDHPTIQAAIDIAAQGDTVIVAAGRWVESLTMGAKGLLLSGSAPDDSVMVSQTVIDGTGEPGATVSISGPQVGVTRLRGLTIQPAQGSKNPDAPRSGLGINCVDSRTRVERCVIARPNQGLGFGFGGGISVGSGGRARLQDCDLDRNGAGKGGAAAVRNGGNAEFLNCRFRDNVALEGGALWVAGGSTVVVSQSLMCGNGDDTWNLYGNGGGAVFAGAGGAVSLLDCQIRDNHGYSGGALHCEGWIEVQGGSISENFAGWQGGALTVIGGGEARLRDVVIARNWGREFGGAIYSKGEGRLVLEGSTVVLNGGGDSALRFGPGIRGWVVNCIIWRNGLLPPIQAEDAVPVVAYSDVEGGYEGVGNIALDPRFCALACGDLDGALAADSPCLGAGFGGEDMGAGSLGCEQPVEPTYQVLEVPAYYATIGEAVEAACSGDTVRVAPGAYQEAFSFLGKDIVVTGTDPQDSATVAQTYVGDVHDTIVRIAHGERRAELIGLTIGGGLGTILPYDHAIGGAMIIGNSSPRIRHCVFRGNQTFAPGEFPGGDGGGLWISHANPLVSDCSFEGNGALSFGGGVYQQAGHSKWIRCAWSGNNADAGGAICVTNGAAELLACRIQNNFAAGPGGGLHGKNGAELRIANTIIAENGARSWQWDPRGGGLACASGTRLDLHYSVVAHNSCDSRVGGGISTDASTEVNARGAIVWSNAAGGFTRNRDLSLGGLTAIEYSRVPPGFDGEGNIHDHPRFTTWRGWTHVLEPGRRNDSLVIPPRSPCIDAGPPDARDGIDWPHQYDNGIRADMGAYGGPLGQFWNPPGVFWGDDSIAARP